MKKLHLIIRQLLVLLVLTLSFDARGFVDPPTFVPAQPYAGQPVEMSVRRGECHVFVAPPPDAPVPAMEVQVSGNIIDVIFTGAEVTPPLCFNPVVVTTRNIGVFPNGSYTVRIRIREITPPYTILPPVSQSGLVVRDTPVSVPAIGSAAIATLTVAIILVMAIHRKRVRPLCCILAAALFHALPGTVVAQTIPPEIVIGLQATDGAPSPNDIVEFDFSSGERPPLAGC